MDHSNERYEMTEQEINNACEALRIELAWLDAIAILDEKGIGN